jgi:molecular chaperone DnaK (HSP70)
MTRIAIDFGSANTKVAYFDTESGRARLLELGTRVRNVIPSLFYLPQDGDEPRVGNDAEELLESDPEGIVSGLKKDIHKMGKVRRGPNRPSPERIQLASQLFRHIRETCEKEMFHGQTINECVLTVPATFEESKQDSIRKAALQAGFEKVELIPEPVAAARAWLATTGKKHQEMVVVCDIGGGTTDFAFVRNKNGNIEVVPEVIPGGVPLGGNDIDDNLFESLLEENPNDAEMFNRNRDGLIVKIRNARELFSRDMSRRETMISIESKRIPLSRDKVEACCADFQEKVCEALAKYLHKCHNMGDYRVFDLLLVGGGSRIPGVKQSIEKIAKQPVMEWRDFEYAVVLGAISVTKNKPKVNDQEKDNSTSKESNYNQKSDKDYKSYSANTNELNSTAPRNDSNIDIVPQNISTNDSNSSNISQKPEKNEYVPLIIGVATFLFVIFFCCIPFFQGMQEGMQEHQQSGIKDIKKPIINDATFRMLITFSFFVIAGIWGLIKKAKT